jgi:hypothetical protein
VGGISGYLSKGLERMNGSCLLQNVLDEVVLP